MTTDLLPLGGLDWVASLARHAAASPAATALRFEGRSTTWAQLHDRVARLAGALAGRGVGRGDRVAVCMANRPEFLEATLAAGALGAIAVPVNPRLTPPEVAFITADCGVAAAATDPHLAPLVPEGVPALVTGAGGSYEAALAAAAPAGAVPVAEGDVALIMYTSGTTGRPKGAMLTHRNLLVQALTLIRTYRLVGAAEVPACTVPMFHIAGIGGFPPALLLGLPTVIAPTAPFTAAATLDLVESEGVTTMFLVPAQWQVLCADPDAGRRGRSLRTIGWGAAPATRSLLEAMAATFPEAAIVSFFGQTEMSPVTTVLAPEDATRKIGSVGRPVPTVVARVVDDAMVDVGPGQVGEIVYRGPGLMAGYWGRPESTAEACAGGWFHSGDLVRVDGEGFVYVVDRKKDMIISGGENVYCAEVEDALAGHPAVADVAVVGAPSERWGETPVAVVVPADPAAPPTLEDLVGWSAGRLASYKKPTVLVVVGELPRNASGKVLKHQLRDRVAGAAAGGR